MEALHDDCFELLVWHAIDGAFTLGYVCPQLAPAVLAQTAMTMLTPNAQGNVVPVAVDYARFLASRNGDDGGGEPDRDVLYALKHLVTAHRSVIDVEARRVAALRPLYALMGVSRTLRHALLTRYWATIHVQLARFYTYARSHLYKPALLPPPPTSAPEYPYLAVLALRHLRRAKTTRFHGLRVHPVVTFKPSKRIHYVQWPIAELRQGNDPVLRIPLPGDMRLLRVGNGSVWKSRHQEPGALKQALDQTVAMWSRRDACLRAMRAARGRQKRH